ncbi:unnamed protein product [Brassica oleracea]
MAKRRSWFGWIKRLFICEAKAKSEKPRRLRWVLRRLKLRHQIATPTQETRTLNKATEDQRKHAMNVAIATAAAAEAAVAGLQPPRQLLRLKALRALKALVRLQAIVRGRAVRRKVSSNKASTSSLIQRKHLSKTKTEIKEELKIPKRSMCNGQNGWDSSALTKEDIKAIWLRKQEGAVKRERMLKYSRSHRERRSPHMLLESLYTTDLGMRSCRLEHWGESKSEMVVVPTKVKLRTLQRQDSGDGQDSQFSFPRRSFKYENIFVEKLLKENILGDEVETSGALKKLGYYIDSSTGVLLCGRHPKAYYLWDPVTRKQHKIPRHRVHFEEVCMSLITEDCPVEGFSYKVVRGECVSYAAHSSKVRVEIYSSKTTTWSYSELACNEAVSLTPWTAGRVIKGVVYWHATGGKVAIYDTEDEEKRIDVIKLPKTFNYDEQVLGESSDGCLQYGWSNKSVMEIWKLEKVGEVLEWTIQFKVNFKAMWRLNPVESARFSTRTKETQLLAFFNQNSDSVFIRCDSHICVFDTKTQRVEEVQYQGRGSSFVWDYCKVLPYFQLSWPCSSSSLLEEGNI